ncbi:hypothetical protein SAMN05660900_02278 [Megasphaera cerevisiae DSM 20462]|jgi:hypothetical protein|nr:hypothetical protein SAMN05660900_02278 [Megasphaera cerevisiae DSM 20462]
MVPALAQHTKNAEITKKIFSQNRRKTAYRAYDIYAILKKCPNGSFLCPNGVEGLGCI